ncbi:MAG: hypothetical protein EA349_12280 [Halomonadaceae bacterium]|nr:MAG: hypothetical protein EA349_12280 [Halomonadaceae bacterium]
MRNPLILPLGALILVLTGCSGFSPQPQDEEDVTRDPTPAVQHDPAAGDKIIQVLQEVQYRDFPSDVLFALLTAELAAQRGHFDVTLANYAQAAQDTRDRGIIQRAIVIAQALGASEVQKELAILWLEKNPNEPQALRVAAVQAIEQGNFEQALVYMERLHDQGEPADFDNLAAYANTLEAAEQVELLALYRELHSRHPDSAEIGYSLALLQHTLEQHEAALATLQPVLTKHPDYQPAKPLKGKLLYDMNRRQEARDYLRTQTRRYPQNRRMGILYARILVDSGEMQAAEDEFALLMRRFPDAEGLRLSRALVALENGNLDIAESLFRDMLDEGQHGNEAHYYLGRLLEDQNKLPEALMHFDQVDSGPRFFSALSRASTMRARKGEPLLVQQQLAQLRQQQPEQAEQFWLVEINMLLDLDLPQKAIIATGEALEEYPDNHNLRYSRAMLYEQQGKLEAMELDLRRILEAEPDNATALNALGYTLTIHTDRHDEAYELIRRAHYLEPENPAIMDSMGWILYQRGEWEEALELLSEAFEAMPDPEIAAHLGEVLWQQDRQEEARLIWRRTLADANEDDNITPILETLERFNLTPEEL